MLQMKRLLYLILATICLTLCGKATAQTNGQEAALAKQRKMFPQEKVYVMTDRDLYLAGDTARMRAWIYDCNERSEKTSKSKYVYAELRDAADNLRLRIKMMNREGLIRGYMALPPDLTSGDYTLAAYTYYMTGTTEEMFFRKRLHVMNPKDISRGLLPNNLNGPVQSHSAISTNVERNVISTNVERSLDSARDDSRENGNINIPAGSNVAVSITADRLCRADSTSNIVWSLAHQPDLFTEDDVRKAGRIFSPTTPYELGQTISGTVYGNISTKKPQQDVRVSLMIPSKKITDMRITGADGRFEFSGFDLPDSTLVFLSAKKGKRTRMENITIDGDGLPERVSHLPALPHYFKRESDVPSEMKIVSSAIDFANTQLLAEIEVRGQKREKITETYQHFAERTLMADDLMNRGIYDLESALLRMPGIRMVNGVLSYRNKPLRFFVDGMEEADFLDDYENDGSEGMPPTSSMVAMSYPMEIIERIDLLKPEDAMMLPGAGRGYAAICITLKEGTDIRKASRSATLKMVFPLGYQKYKKFHKPADDLSWPIVYWNSNLTIKDNTTLARIVAKTLSKQKAGSYTLHIDGFTPEGEPLHVEKTFEKLKD